MLYRPELRGTEIAVSSTHWLASAVGSAMLEQGGNAFDAATAAAFVLQVVEPHMNGPAGDVPILLYEAASKTTKCICGQGPLPRAATIAAFRERGLREVPGSGLLAACVPGAFGAWMRLLRDYGKLSLLEVLEPAIHYAERGYPALPELSATIEALVPLLRNEWIETGRLYLTDGGAPVPGARVRNVDLARTFRRIVAEATSGSGSREYQIDKAISAFYSGFVADEIHRFVGSSRMLDSTGRYNNGLLTGDDLSSWHPDVENTVSTNYRGFAVHKPGPWSQGPVLLQQLALLGGFDLSGMAFGSAQHLHTVIESAKLAFADRDAWYGDPKFVDVPLGILLSENYSAARRALISDVASGKMRPGSPGGRGPIIPIAAEPEEIGDDQGWRSELGNGSPIPLRYIAGAGDTCCVAAADRDGNLVVATPSGGWLKGSPVIPGLGFPLGTRGQMAWLHDGHNNSLKPGKRPRTTLSPTLLLRDDSPYLAFGTPGGDQQDQWGLNFLVNHVDFGMRPQAASEAPTFHIQHFPTSFTPHISRARSVVLEEGFDPVHISTLERQGHEIELRPAHSLSMLCAAVVERDGLLAAASHRGAQAYAIVR